MGRSTGLVCGVLDMSFHFHSVLAARNCVENQYCFNKWTLRTFDDKFPRELNNYKLFRGNISFHVDSDGRTLS